MINTIHVKVYFLVHIQYFSKSLGIIMLIAFILSSDEHSQQDMSFLLKIYDFFLFKQFILQWRHNKNRMLHLSNGYQSDMFNEQHHKKICLYNRYVYVLAFVRIPSLRKLFARIWGALFISATSQSSSYPIVLTRLVVPRFRPLENENFIITFLLFCKQKLMLLYIRTNVLYPDSIIFLYPCF